MTQVLLREAFNGFDGTSATSNYHGIVIENERKTTTISKE